MSRRSISRIDVPCCYHITQRCQERRFLLRFKQDRRQYLRRLREASRLHGVSVLNFMVTSNHVHLLLWSERASAVSCTMQYLSGSAAQDYNRRKQREGAFWSGRFRPTLVQTGRHVSRCFFYISLNMVRAGVVSHPSEWFGGSHAELCGSGGPGRIIDQERLLFCLEWVSPARFRDWYERTLADECAWAWHARQWYWSEAAAIGDKDWIGQLASRFPGSWRKVRAIPEEPRPGTVAETPGTYMLDLSNRKREGLLATLR